MKINFSVLFYLKKSKKYVCGPAPIYLRITVDGKRAETSSGREVEPERWNSKAGRARGTKEDIRSLNAYLDMLLMRVRDAQQKLLETGSPITAEGLRDQFAGKTAKPKMLLELFLGHNEQIKTLLGKGFEANTLKGYNTSVKHLTVYLKMQYQASDIAIDALNYAFITGFEHHLRRHASCSAVSSAKYITHLKKIVNQCLANGWLKQNPFAHYKSKVKAKEREFLSGDELERMVQKVLPVERVSQVRDIFVFCCYTDLAYVDVKKLKRSEVSPGIDQRQWLFIQRKKTGTSSRIPLLPAALEILNRYDNNPQCHYAGLLLPVLSNQKMNAYLKEIADVCGIIKTLTFHLARHTFATTVTLNNGVPIESVSKMMGHTNIKTTQHYAKILDRKVSDDMKVLMGKYL